MGFEVLVSGVHRFGVFTNERPQVRKGRCEGKLDWPRGAYKEDVESGGDVAENRLGRHNGAKPMTGDAVALGKREEMDDSGPPIATLGRVEQVMGNTGENEIPVCFVKDEGDIPGLRELRECTQELRSIDGAGLRPVSERDLLG